MNAEHFQLLRRDAMNLVNLHVRRYCEEQFDNAPPIVQETFWLKAFQLVASPGGAHPQMGRVSYWKKNCRNER